MNWWVLKRKIHSSWLVAIVCGGIFIGVFVAQYVKNEWFSSPFSLIIATLIIIMAFGQLSNVSLFANLLVLPLVPLAMLLTFIAGVGALIMPAIGWIVAAPATWLLKYMVGVAEYFANLPWVISKLDMQWWGVTVIYLVISAACFYMWRVTKFNLRDVNIVE